MRLSGAVNSRCRRAPSFPCVTPQQHKLSLLSAFSVSLSTEACRQISEEMDGEVQMLNHIEYTGAALAEKLTLIWRKLASKSYRHTGYGAGLALVPIESTTILRPPCSALFLPGVPHSAFLTLRILHLFLILAVQCVLTGST